MLAPFHIVSKLANYVLSKIVSKYRCKRTVGCHRYGDDYFKPSKHFHFHHKKRIIKEGKKMELITWISKQSYNLSKREIRK